jgi:hypothetical protein
MLGGKYEKLCLECLREIMLLPNDIDIKVDVACLEVLQSPLTRKLLRPDVYIPEPYNIVIEYQGESHYTRSTSEPINDVLKRRILEASDIILLNIPCVFNGKCKIKQYLYFLITAFPRLASYIKPTYLNKTVSCIFHIDDGIEPLRDELFQCQKIVNSLQLKIVTLARFKNIALLFKIQLQVSQKPNKDGSMLVQTEHIYNPLINIILVHWFSEPTPEFMKDITTYMHSLSWLTEYSCVSKNCYIEFLQALQSCRRTSQVLNVANKVYSMRPNAVTIINVPLYLLTQKQILLKLYLSLLFDCVDMLTVYCRPTNFHGLYRKSTFRKMYEKKHNVKKNTKRNYPHRIYRNGQPTRRFKRSTAITSTTTNTIVPSVYVASTNNSRPNHPQQSLVINAGSTVQDKETLHLC